MFVVHQSFAIGDKLYARGDVVAATDVAAVSNSAELRKRVSQRPDEVDSKPARQATTPPVDSKE